MQVFFALKANKSQAKEIELLLIQKKIQVELTSMDDNNAEQPENKYRSKYDLFTGSPSSVGIVNMTLRDSVTSFSVCLSEEYREAKSR